MRGKITKRFQQRQRWMEKQINLPPPKDPNWFFKFNLAHLGYYLFFKQFGLKNDEIYPLIDALLEE